MRAAVIAWMVALALVVVGAATAAAAPRWDVAIDRGAITVVAEAGLERIARRVADRAPRTLAAIREDLSRLPQPARIEIRIVADSRDLAAAAPADRGAPRWAAGVAYPDLGVVVLAVGRPGGRFDVDKTLDHELAHLALGAAVPNAPRWLHEGFAWQFAADLDWSRMETLAGMAWFGSVIPLDQLVSAFPADELPASRAYAQSYDLVRYLVGRGRYVDRDDDGDRYPWQEFLYELGRGKSIDDAARAAYGADLDELFAEWKTDMTRRYLMVPATLFATGLWLLAALLLVIGWWRRRRRARAILARWGAIEAEAEARRAAGEVATDDDAAEPSEPEPPSDPNQPPRWIN
ncbi:MAG: hypothetical protein KBD62_04570 [Kofleriaceae bacterium]|nr:hypothetical protein [Kofleriaceae bacterium]